MSDAEIIPFVEPPRRRTFAQRILGVRTVSGAPRDARSAVRKGVSATKLKVLQDGLGVTREGLAELLAVTTRTVDRRARAKQPLALATSDRAVRLIEVLDRAAAVLGSEERARAWLHEPVVALGGETPLAWLDTEPGADEVLRVLMRIEHGVFS